MLIFILVALTGLYVYERTVIPNLKGWFNRKPFNCIYCLSFWLGIGLALYTIYGIAFLALPLLYRFTQIKLLK